MKRELEYTINNVAKSMKEQNMFLHPVVTVQALKANFLNSLLYGSLGDKLNTILMITQGSLNLDIDIIDIDNGVTKVLDTLPALFEPNNIDGNKLQNLIIQYNMVKTQPNRMTGEYVNALENLKHSVLEKSIADLWWPILYKYADVNINTHIVDNINSDIENLIER